MNGTAQSHCEMLLSKQSFRGTLWRYGIIEAWLTRNWRAVFVKTG
jgi:hypothetical protein